MVASRIALDVYFICHYSCNIHHILSHPVLLSFTWKILQSSSKTLLSTPALSFQLSHNSLVYFSVYVFLIRLGSPAHSGFRSSIDRWPIFISSYFHFCLWYPVPCCLLCPKWCHWPLQSYSELTLCCMDICVIIGTQ